MIAGLVLALTQWLALVQSPPIGPPPPPEPDREPPASGSAGASTSEPAPARSSIAASVEAAVASMAAEHPGLVTSVRFGTSRGGAPLVAAVLGDARTGDPGARPALLVVTGVDPQDDGRPRGPETALALARHLVQRAAADAATAALLARVTIYVAPACDPDALAAPGASAPRACRLDRNFPAGWQPWSSPACPQGPYPLSEPETRALARFVADRANVAAVLELSSAKAADAGRARAPTALEAKLGGDVGAIDSRPFEPDDASLAREPGSFAAFALARAGVSVVRFDPWSVRGDVPAADALRTIASSLAGELPALAARESGRERVREKLWLVDVTIENSGLVPTLAGAARAERETSAWLRARGGRVVAASARDDVGAEVALVRRKEDWFLGHLDGGRRLRLELAVEGEADSKLVLSFATIRGGSSELELQLH